MSMSTKQKKFLTNRLHGINYRYIGAKNLMKRTLATLLLKSKRRQRKKQLTDKTIFLFILHNRLGPEDVFL